MQAVIGLIQHLIHKEMAGRDVRLPGYTNIVGVQAWENDTKT